MTPARTCNNCNGPKPDDAFRACPSCRTMWRTNSRKRRGRPVEALRRTVAIDSDVLDALAIPAKARGVSTHALVRSLLATIADDCLTGAILDDVT